MGNGCMSINAVKTADAPTPKFKLIVVGDTGVGKTSVIQRYARNFFSSEYIPTELLNIESVVRKLSIPDQGIVTVELWDVPTCDELSTRKTYYMDTDAVIVVVDVCDEDIAEISNQWRLDAVTNIVTSKGELSLENGIKNQPQVEKSNHPPKAGSIPVLLLGNKFDIAKSRFIHDHLSTNGVDATKVTFNNNQHVSTIQNQQITINVEMEVDVESHVNKNGDSHDHMNGNGDSHDHMNEIGDSQNHMYENGGSHDHMNGNGDSKNYMNGNGKSHDDSKNHVNVEKQTDHEMSKDEIHDTKNHEINDINNHEKPCDETHGEVVRMEKDFKTDENDKENHENEMGDKNKDPDGLMDSENSHKNLKNKESDELKKEESNNEDIMRENNNMQSDHVPSYVNGDTGDMNHGDHELQDDHVNDGKMDTTNVDANSPHDKLMDNTQKKLQKLFPKDLKDENSDLKSSANSNILNHNSTRSVESDIVADGSVVSATTCSTLPPCVDMLEQVAEDYGFVAGIPVSAKDPNGGIHEAIQSLVRHLMVKRRAAAPERKRKTDEISMKSHISVGTKRTRRNKRNLPEVEFDPLQDVGIIEIDEILRRCNPVLREAEVLVGGYREAIHDFKRACHKKNMTGSNRVSIEECISALKEAVSSPLDVAMEKTDVKTRLLLHEKTNGKSYSLVSDDVNGFVDLLVVDDNHEYLNTAPSEGESPIPTHVRLVLQVYKEKVHKSCSSVLESSNDLEQILTQLCHQVADKEEKAWDVAVAAGYSQSNVRRILSSLAQGKARMMGTMQQIKDAKKQVLNTQSRIKAALLF